MIQFMTKLDFLVRVGGSPFQPTLVKGHIKNGLGRLPDYRCPLRRGG